MEQESRRSIRVNVSGGNNQGWNLGENHGVIRNVQHAEQRTEILDALTVLLSSRDVIWPSVEDRVSVERAVDAADIEDADLKPALRRVLAVSQPIGVGVLSSALFEILKSFAMS